MFGDDDRVAQAAICDRDRTDLGQQLRDELCGNVSRRHFEEERRPKLPQDFERVVPPHRMRDVGGEVLANRLGVSKGTTAAIADVGH